MGNGLRIGWGLWCGPCARDEGGGSLAGLVDVLVDVVGRRQLLHRRHGLRVSHLRRGWGEVLIALRSTNTHGKLGLKKKKKTVPFLTEVRFVDEQPRQLRSTISVLISFCTLFKIT